MRADEEHQPQGCQDEYPHQWTRQQRRTGELIRQPRDERGHGHTGSHVVVDAQHVAAKPGVDRECCVAGPGCRQVLVIV